MLRKPRIVGDRKQKEHAKALINEWAKIRLELYDWGREMLAKLIVDLLHNKNFEPNEIRQTLVDISTYLLYVCEMCTKSYKLLVNVQERSKSLPTHWLFLKASRDNKVKFEYFFLFN